MYWPVKITKWEETNLLPLGSLAAKPIGEAGDAQAEVMKALEENDLMEHNKDFTDAQLDEVQLLSRRTLCLTIRSGALISAMSSQTMCSRTNYAQHKNK